MKRVLGFAFVALGLAIAAPACSDERDHGFSASGGGTAGSYGGGDSCTQYSTCGACTPVDGCGWCNLGNGQGTCLSDPDECNAQTFGWTWTITGCSVPAEAGVGEPVAPDAGLIGTPVDGGAPLGPPAIDAGGGPSVPDAGPIPDANLPVYDAASFADAASE